MSRSFRLLFLYVGVTETKPLSFNKEGWQVTVVAIFVVSEASAMAAGFFYSWFSQFMKAVKVVVGIDNRNIEN